MSRDHLGVLTLVALENPPEGWGLKLQGQHRPDCWYVSKPF